LLSFCSAATQEKGREKTIEAPRREAREKSSAHFLHRTTWNNAFGMLLLWFAALLRLCGTM